MAFNEDQKDHLTNTLDPNVVKPAPQGKYGSYIEGWYVIQEANRIFGFDAWDSKTDLEFISEYETGGKWRVCYRAVCTIIVRADGDLIVRQGSGFGQGIDKDKGMAHESALKEAETDARKRAFITFGNPFGLALYDKTQENVAPPRESKANSRGLYEALQSAMRAKQSYADLHAWGKANAEDIRSLPADWEETIRDEFARELAAFKESEAAGQQMDDEYAATVAAQ